MPTDEEAQNVRIFIPRVFERARDIESHELHLVFVDDDSPDGIAQVVRGLQGDHPRLHLVTGHRRGLGDAWQRGFTWALEHFSPELLLQMDADRQHPPALIHLFVRLLVAGHGYTLVIGSRFAPSDSTADCSRGLRLLSLFGK